MKSGPSRLYFMMEFNSVNCLSVIFGPAWRVPAARSAWASSRESYELCPELCGSLPWLLPSARVTEASISDARGRSRLIRSSNACWRRAVPAYARPCRPGCAGRTSGPDRRRCPRSNPRFACIHLDRGLDLLLESTSSVWASSRTRWMLPASVRGGRRSPSSSLRRTPGHRGVHSCPASRIRLRLHALRGRSPRVSSDRRRCSSSRRQPCRACPDRLRGGPCR